MNQSPINWAGTGPPAGGLAAAEAAGSFAEDVGWSHDEATRTNAMLSRAVGTLTNVFARI
jgi:hypothetical protein